MGIRNLNFDFFEIAELERVFDSPQMRNEVEIRNVRAKLKTKVDLSEQVRRLQEKEKELTESLKVVRKDW